MKYLDKLFRSQKDFVIRDLHTINILVITSHNLGFLQSRTAFTTIVKGVWKPQLRDVITKIFMVWRSGITKPFWDRSNLPKVLQKGLWSLLDYSTSFWKNHQNPKFRHFRLYVKEAQRAKRGLFSDGNTTVIRQNRP